MLAVHLAFPRGPEKTFPVGFVEGGENITTTANQAVGRRVIHFQSFDRCRNIADCNAVWSRFGRVFVQNVRCETGRQESWQVVGIVLVSTRLATCDGNPPGMLARQVGGKV